MNKLELIIKHSVSLLSLVVSLVLFHGCGLDPSKKVARFGFQESEQVVEVDAQTKSFSIVGKWTEGDMQGTFLPRWPLVYLDTTNTTARHNVHYIGYEAPMWNTIGYFAPLGSNEGYRECVVKLLPENIKSEQILHYEVRSYTNLHNLILTHKVTLIPKTN